MYLITGANLKRSRPSTVAGKLQSPSWQVTQNLSLTDGISALAFIYAHNHTHNMQTNTPLCHLMRQVSGCSQETLGNSMLIFFSSSLLFLLSLHLFFPLTWEAFSLASHGDINTLRTVQGYMHVRLKVFLKK